MSYQIGDRVIVDAAVMGDGIHRPAVITDVYEFLSEAFIDVMFDEPTSDGWKGYIITNLALIRKEEIS